MKKLRVFFFLTIFFTFSVFSENPFYLGLSYDHELSHEDYLEVQERLRTIDVSDYIKSIYENLEGDFKAFEDTYGRGTKGDFKAFEDIYGRCTRGLRQSLIDPSKNYYPKKVFRKMGNGGKDNCIVCCVPYDGRYPYYVLTIEKELEKIGYNGCLLYYVGGWPNPTGKEIEFCSVPYSFKIFAMHEAYLLGCKNVLWVDSACLPLRNPEPLFENIKRTGAVLNHFKVPRDAYQCIFPSTQAELLELTGTDVLDSKNYYINTIVFGLKMDTPQAKKLTREFYKMAEMGTPFLSCFPEEWVLSAIMGQPQFKKMRKQRAYPYLFWKSLTNADDSSKEYKKEYKKAKKAGYYFFHRMGR